MREGALKGAMLLAGIAFLAASGGSHAVAWAPFLANLFLLRFVDRMPPRAGLFILAPLYMATIFVAWFGIVPRAPIALFAALAVVYGAPYVLPFAAHRLLRPEQNAPFIYTLVFPAAWVCVEYLLRLFSPFGSWISLAYSQDASGSLAQLVSLGGIAAVSFYITWASSIGAWLLDRVRSDTALPMSLVAGVLAMVALAFWGEWRVRNPNPDVRTVAVASVNPNHALQDAANNTMGLASQPFSVDTKQRILVASNALNRDL